MSLPRLVEPGTSGVALQCTNHYTNRAITILLYKLRYINITSSIQDQIIFQKKAGLSTKTILKHESFKQIDPSKIKTCLLTMQYTKSYGCAVLFLQDISQIHDSMRKTQTKNIAETCFDTVKHLYFVL